MKKAFPLILLAVALSAPLRAEITPRVDARRINIAAAQRSFVLPGLGQWYKGDKGRAVAIWTLETTFVGLSYHSFQRAKAAEEDFRAGAAPYSRYTRKVEQANFMLLAAGVTWFYGVLDAYFAVPPGMTASVNPEGDVQVAWSVRF